MHVDLFLSTYPRANFSRLCNGMHVKTGSAVWIVTAKAWKPLEYLLIMPDDASVLQLIHTMKL
jgi:hypothetical protein